MQPSDNLGTEIKINLTTNEQLGFRIKQKKRCVLFHMTDATSFYQFVWISSKKYYKNKEFCRK